MQDIREAISDLIAGNAKQATGTIDMLISRDQNFFSHLTALILGINTHPLKAKPLTVAIATLNATAVRLSKKCAAKDFLKVEQIYDQLRRIMCSATIDFQNKKLLLPALTEMVGSLCARHKEMMELKEMIAKGDDRRSMLIIVSAIIASKSLSKAVKIQCITEMFQIMMEEIICYSVILSNSCPVSSSGMAQIPRNGWKEYTKFDNCVDRIKYCVDLLYAIFYEIFQTIEQPYQYQALLLLSCNPYFSQLIVLAIGWQNNSIVNCGKIPWLEDMKFGSTICQFYEVNNLKQKAFRILSTILHKTSESYSFYHSSNQLLARIPELCKRVVIQVIQISPDFQALNKDYLIGSVCDSMLQFMAQTLRFNDLLIIYAENVSLDQLVICLATYLRVRDTDIDTMEGQYFCHFLEGFAGTNNFNQITRYSISELMEACCNKFDSFPAKMFNYCFHGILNNLHTRLTNQSLNIDEDCYQHLYTSPHTLEVMEGKHADMGCCLLGLVALQKQIRSREDFRHALTEFFTIMDCSHFNQEEITIIFYLLGTHVQLFEQHNLLEVLGNFITYALDLAQSDPNCSILCFEFVKRVYINFLLPQLLSHSMSQKYISICSKIIWPQLIKGFSLPRTVKNEYFWETIRDLIAVSNLDSNHNEDQPVKQGSQMDKLIAKQKRKKKIMRVEKVGQYLLTQISSVMLVVLEQSCEKLQLLMNVQHQSLIAERIHQLIMQCISSLCWVNQLTADLQISKVQFKQYVGAVENLIVNVAETLDLCSRENSQKVGNLMQIVSTLLGQQHEYYPVQKTSSSPITCRCFQALLPAMLDQPFTQHWLVCICEFTHRIEGKYKLSEVQRLLQIIKLAYTQHINNELRLNEVSLFATVLLNYEQPQNWCSIHEIVRVNLVKLMRVEAVEEKAHRKIKIRELGFESEAIFGITVIRLFHVYLFGFRMEPVHELMAEILGQIQKFSHKYTAVEASHLINGLRSSYKFMSQHNWEKILNIILLVLNKLMLNDSYYGNQTHQQSAIRRLSQKVGCLGLDPYQQFRQLVRLLNSEGVFFQENGQFGSQIRSMMNIITKQGQPRKLYSILRPKA